jgi:hypothetical protein
MTVWMFKKRQLTGIKRGGDLGRREGREKNT